MMNCYVLVGGRSSRMGQSKAALFLERVAAAARDVFDDVIAVQRPGGEPMPGITTITEEPHDDDGPIYGVVRALEHAAGERCFVLAVDYAAITPGALREIRRRVDDAPFPFVVPMWDGHPQVLCAAYGAELLPRLRARIASGRLDLRGLIGEVPTEIISEAELRALLPGEPLRSINTPAEWRELDGR